MCYLYCFGFVVFFVLFCFCCVFCIVSYCFFVFIELDTSDAGNCAMQMKPKQEKRVVMEMIR